MNFLKLMTVFTFALSFSSVPIARAADAVTSTTTTTSATAAPDAHPDAHKDVKAAEAEDHKAAAHGKKGAEKDGDCKHCKLKGKKHCKECDMANKDKQPATKMKMTEQHSGVDHLDEEHDHADAKATDKDKH